MSQKRFNFKQYAVRLPDGETLTIQCSSARAGDHTSQRAYVRRYFKNESGFYTTYSEYTGYSQYVNRPWESFDYECAIHALSRNFDRAGEHRIGQEIRSWIEAHKKEDRAAAEAFFDDFKREYDKASPGMKEALAAAPPLETEDQAKTTLAVLKMGNLLRSLENADTENN